MKNLFLIAMIALGAAACSSEAENSPVTSIVDESDLTVLQWIDSSQNLGKIKEGQKLQIAFRFRNAGNKPLVIHSVQPGCGCTVADYPKQPIAPGAEAEISGAFDSQGREGLQHKQIIVNANTVGSQTHQVEFMVEVLKSK